jgi:hypothetical protein
MPLGSFIEDGAGPAVGLRLSTQATPSGPIRALGPGCQPHKGRMAGAQPCRGRPFSSPPRPGGGGPRSRPGWSASPRCRPLRPSVVPAVPRPAGESPPPDSGDARQGSSGTAACPPWPSGTPSWATRARCRPPQPDGGSGEDQVRPYRWIGLPRRIPLRAADPEAVPGPKWTGCSSSHEGGRGKRHGAGGHAAACRTNRTIMQTGQTAGHSPIGPFQRTCYVVSASATTTQSPQSTADLPGGTKLGNQA